MFPEGTPRSPADCLLRILSPGYGFDKYTGEGASVHLKFEESNNG